MLRSLRTRKGRDETGLFLAEGVRLCEELLASGLPVETALVSEAALADRRTAELIRRLTAASVPMAEAAPRDFERVSDTVNSQGIAIAARAPETRLEEIVFSDRATVLALDGVADPGNVGTAVRTAAWFGAAAVLLGRGCADLLNPKTVRATMGGMFHLPVCRDADLPDALRFLKQAGFRVTAAAMDGSPEWRGWRGAKRSALLLGSEARGITRQAAALADETVAIPRRGAGESLNVAVAVGVLLADE